MLSYSQVRVGVILTLPSASIDLVNSTVNESSSNAGSIEISLPLSALSVSTTTLASAVDSPLLPALSIALTLYSTAPVIELLSKVKT